MKSESTLTSCDHFVLSSRWQKFELPFISNTHLMMSKGASNNGTDIEGYDTSGNLTHSVDGN